VIPMGNSFLYVEPVYVRSAQTTAVPELKRVIVVNGDVVGLADTFSDALSASLQGQAGSQKPGGSTGGSVDQQVTALLNQALQHFAAADAALANQDLARYQSEIKLGQVLVRQANALAANAAARGSGSGGSASPSASPPASPSVSPSPSPSP
jgi:uncharacterized membrane protein (UPF0182 family)